MGPPHWFIQTYVVAIWNIMDCRDGLAVTSMDREKIRISIPEEEHRIWSQNQIVLHPR
jgi:hypothetical protein